jgi:hypothetical protein
MPNYERNTRKTELAAGRSGSPPEDSFPARAISSCMKAVITLSIILVFALSTGCVMQGPEGPGIAGPPTGVPTPTGTTPLPGTPIKPTIPGVETTPLPILGLALPGVVYRGENVTISGTTILTIGQPIMVEVVSAEFGPANKTEDTMFSGASGVVRVTGGRELPHYWSFSFSTSGFRPGLYLVQVYGLEVNVAASTQFELLPGPRPVGSFPETPVRAPQ